MIERTERVQAHLGTRAGSLLVDALLSIAIFGLIISAFSTGISGGREGTVRGGNRTRAIYLAEEGLEAVRSIRDKTNGYATITGRPGSPDEDGVQLSGTEWGIAPDPTVIDSLFTRKIVFSSAGLPSNTRKVTSTVSWTEVPSNQIRSVTLETYLTDWRTDPPPPAPDWSLACVETFTIGFEDYVDIVVDGNYAYITESSSPALYIIDLTTDPPSMVVDPELPLILPGLGPHSIVKKNNYVYVSNDSAASEILTVDVDLSVPANPQVVNQEDVPGVGYGKGLALKNNTLYLARTDDPGLISGLPVPEYIEYDIGANPVNPVPITDRSVNLDRTTYAVAVTDDGYAYLAAQSASDELTTVNGSVTPPTVLAGADVDSGTRGVSTALYDDGNALYMGVSANFPYKVYAFDISSPGTPTNNPILSDDEYDPGGDPGTGEVRDIAISAVSAVAFLAANTKIGAVWPYFQVLDLSIPLDIDGTPLASLDMASGGCPGAGVMCDAGDGAKGIFFRATDPIFLSDVVYMVGGPHLVVFKPGGC